MKAKYTTDAVKILRNRFFKDDTDFERLVAEEFQNCEVAQLVYDLRESAGLTQKELAAKVGTTASVISRLEDADYYGHSLRMLTRIAFALDKKVELKFVDKEPKPQKAQQPKTIAKRRPNSLAAKTAPAKKSTRKPN